MARIRSIKPEFFRHSDLYEAEQETGFPIRIAFAGLWTAADREGRFKWRPRELKLDCLPHDVLDFSRVLDALSTRGFIVQYEVSGELFGFIPSWSEHQIVNNREAVSVLPAPTESSIKSTTSTRAPRVPVASSTRHDLDQGEGKGKEGKGKEGESASPSASVDNPKPKAKRKTQLPDNFCVSDQVKAWAAQKGFGQLDDHLDAFKRKAQAKGYSYIDWDLAFMEAIREDWAKLRGRTSNGAAPPAAVEDTTLAGTLAAQANKRMLDERDKGVSLMPAHIRAQITSALQRKAA